MRLRGYWALAFYKAAVQVRPPEPQVCSIPLVNVMPRRNPDPRMKIVPPPGRDRMPNVRMPAPPCRERPSNSEEKLK